MKVVIALISGLLLAHAVNAAEPAEVLTVYKSPTCGCCDGWIDYLRENGFEVKAQNTDKLADLKADLGLTDKKLMSCHTAVIDGYIIEGHVPVDDIKRLLSERPDIAGITAPGMPQFSPGMRSIEPKGYDVLSFDADGNTDLFSRY